MRKLRNTGTAIRIDDRLETLRDTLRDVDNLIAVYLFGSYGTHWQTPLSDVDLALVFRNGRAPAFDEEMRIRGRILDALREDDVSITVLNRAPALFQFRVFATGRPLYILDDQALADVIGPMLSRHADFRLDYDRFTREYDEACHAHG